MKAAKFHPAAMASLRGFPKEIKNKIGDLVLDLQNGRPLTMPESRPMPSVGQGVHEIRVKDSENQYRAFYYLKVKDKILVFHTFIKKTEKTLKREIGLGKKRLKELLEVLDE